MMKKRRRRREKRERNHLQNIQQPVRKTPQKEQRRHQANRHDRLLRRDLRRASDHAVADALAPERLLLDVDYRRPPRHLLAYLLQRGLRLSTYDAAEPV